MHSKSSMTHQDAECPPLKSLAWKYQGQNPTRTTPVISQLVSMPKSKIKSSLIYRSICYEVEILLAPQSPQSPLQVITCCRCVRTLPEVGGPEVVSEGKENGVASGHYQRWSGGGVRGKGERGYIKGTQARGGPKLYRNCICILMMSRQSPSLDGA